MICPRTREIVGESQPLSPHKRIKIGALRGSRWMSKPLAS
eukprot:COSAG01_NODE_62073_length_285_cov_0.941176_1_plen_39_part_10